MATGGGLNAGRVYVDLGGDFQGGGFEKFDEALRKARAQPDVDTKLKADDTPANDTIRRLRAALALLEAKRTTVTVDADVKDVDYKIETLRKALKDAEKDASAKKLSGDLKDLGLVADDLGDSFNGGNGGRGPGLVSGLWGAFNNIGLMGKAAVAAGPAVLGLAGGVSALVGSLAQAVVGGGILGVGGIAAFVTGLAGTIAVVKPLTEDLKAVKKAQDAYNQAVTYYGTGSKQAQIAQAKLNEEIRVHGGKATASFLKDVEKIGPEWRKQTTEARSNVITILGGAIDVARKDMHTFAGVSTNATEGLKRGFRDAFKLLGGGEFRRILHDLGKGFENMAPKGIRGLTNFFVGLGHVAQAALPYVEGLAKGFERLSKRFLDFTRDRSSLDSWVKRQVGQFKAWSGLIGSTLKLLKDFFGAGAPEGKGLVQSLTDTFDRWDAWIKDNPAKMKKFFSDAATSTRQIGEAFVFLTGTIGKLLAGVLPGFNSAMGDIGKSAAPVLRQLGEYAGLLLKGFLGLASVTLPLLLTAMRGLTTVLTPVINAISWLVKNVPGLKEVAGAFLAITLAVKGGSAALNLVKTDLGRVRDLWTRLATAAEGYTAATAAGEKASLGQKLAHSIVAPLQTLGSKAKGYMNAFKTWLIGTSTVAGAEAGAAEGESYLAGGILSKFLNKFKRGFSAFKKWLVGSSATAGAEAGVAEGEAHVLGGIAGKFLTKFKRAFAVFKTWLIGSSTVAGAEAGAAEGAAMAAGLGSKGVLGKMAAAGGILGRVLGSVAGPIAIALIGKEIGDWFKKTTGSPALQGTTGGGGSPGLNPSDWTNPAKPFSTGKGGDGGGSFSDAGGRGADLGTGGHHATRPHSTTSHAQGGAIGHGVGGGDRRVIMAEDGEHMLTKEEVLAAGGHNAIHRLRKMLRAGILRLQQGGAVGAAPELSTSGGSTAKGAVYQVHAVDDFVNAKKRVSDYHDHAKKELKGLTDDSVKESKQFRKDNEDHLKDFHDTGVQKFKDVRKDSVDELVGLRQDGIKEVGKFTDDFHSKLDSARRSGQAQSRKIADVVTNSFGDMDTNSNRVLKKLVGHVSSQFGDAQVAAKQGSAAIASSVAASFMSTDRAVYQGSNYIQVAVGHALKGLGGGSISLNVPAPKGLAGGGILGGDSSADDHYVIGPDGEPKAAISGSEGIVNEPQMGIIDRVMNWAYEMGGSPFAGLQDMWDRSHMKHYAAGGRLPAASNATTTASGEISGGRWSRLIAAANKVDAQHWPYKWGGGHEQPAHFEPFDCSGTVSYVTQQAGYKVPTTVAGNMGSWGFPKGPGRATIFYNPTHTFMRLGGRYFGTSGSWRPNGGAGWFTGTPGAGYLSGFKQIHLPNVGSGDVPKLTVQGPNGELLDLAQGSLNRERGAANQLITRRINSADAGSGQWGDIKSGDYQGPLDRTFPSHHGWSGARLHPSQVALLAGKAGLPVDTFVKIAHGESQYFPGIITNDGGYGLWQMTPRVQGASTVAAWHRIGSYFNPWKNALQAKYLYDRAPSKTPRTRGFPWFGTKYLQGGGLIGAAKRHTGILAPYTTTTGHTRRHPRGPKAPVPSRHWNPFTNTYQFLTSTQYLGLQHQWQNQHPTQAMPGGPKHVAQLQVTRNINPLTGHVERHNSKEWAAIRLEYRRQQAAIRREQQREQRHIDNIARQALHNTGHLETLQSDVTGGIDELSNDYTHFQRVADSTVEDLTTEAGRKQHTAEIGKLQGIKAEQWLALSYQRSLVRMEARKYQRAIRKLRDELRGYTTGPNKSISKGGPKKLLPAVRKKLIAQINQYVRKYRSLMREARRLGFDLDDIGLDIKDLQRQLDDDIKAATPTEIDFINQAIAQASLTPGLGDDIAAYEKLETFYTTAYQAAVATGDPGKITEAANNLAGAQGQLQSLRDAADPSKTPDAQAQIAQLTSRVEAADANVFAGQQELAVFKGSGDIGFGGVNAFSATANQPPVGSGSGSLSGTAGSPSAPPSQVPEGWYLTQVTSPEGQKVVGQAANSFNAGAGYTPAPREYTGA